MFTVVSAFDSQICCLKSARYNWTNGILPWDSCAVGANYVQGTYGLGEVPQVNATLGFCMENCPGVQISTVNQWLALLTSWILPAIALLLTCSTGWKKRADVREIAPWREVSSPWFNRVQNLNSVTDAVLAFGLVPYQLQEFMAILGDPASAIRGAFSEVVLNVRLVHGIYHPGDFDRLVKSLAIVAGQTKFTEDVDVKLTYFILRNGLSAAIDPFKKIDDMADLRKALDKFAEEKEQLLKTDSPKDEVTKKIKLKVIKEIRLMLNEGKENLGKCLQALKDSLGCDLDKTDPPIDCVQCKLHDEIVKVLGKRFANTVSEKGDFGIGDAKTRDPGTEYVGKQGVNSESIAEVTTKRIQVNKGDTQKSLFEQCKWAEELQTGIQVSLQSRVDFMKGIVLPVILGLVATAGSFYSAYNQIGDNDTAHALAYGVWYSWAIIIAVVSNCYVATANPGVAKLALKCDFLSDVTVPLRERSENTQRWMKWLTDIGCGEGTDPGPASSEKGGFRSKAWSSFKLLIEQTLAWICIGMPCACAASISYTTPTVGLGCRSFTFLLYGICTLVLSWLSAYRGQVENRMETWSLRVCLRALYAFGVCVNVFIISAGTAFDLIGLYRSCRCEVLFVSNDFLLQMSSNTALDVANAKKFWLPVGYVDFGFVWIVCMIAVTCRSYVAYCISLLLHKWDNPFRQVEGPLPQSE